MSVEIPEANRLVELLAAKGVKHTVELGRAVRAGVPVCAKQQHPVTPRESGEMDEESLACPVGPVQIVDDDDRRALGRDCLNEVGDGAKQPLLVLPGLLDVEYGRF